MQMMPVMDKVQKEILNNTLIQEPLLKKKEEENILLPNHLTTRKKASQTPKNTHEKRPRSVNSHEKSTATHLPALFCC